MTDVNIPDRHDLAVIGLGSAHQSATLGAVSRDEAGVASVMTHAIARIGGVIEIALSDAITIYAPSANGPTLPQLQVPESWTASPGQFSSAFGGAVPEVFVNHSITPYYYA